MPQRAVQFRACARRSSSTAGKQAPNIPPRASDSIRPRSCARSAKVDLYRVGAVPLDCGALKAQHWRKAGAAAGIREELMKIVPSLFVCALSIAPAFANDLPKFQVDASWPTALPNNWIMRQAAGVAVDAPDHAWVIQRPRSLTDDEKAATFNPPRTKCCVPAPPVMEFDQDGNLLRAWGGPGQGYDWFENEHGINIDHKGFVWVGGNGNNDGHVLKFTPDGKFVLQIGRPGPQTGSADTTRLGRPADTEVDPATNELYVADGYGNHRVIILDADTGAYKRHWGAYGKA